MTASARWRGGPHVTPGSNPPCSTQAKPKKPGSRKRAAAAGGDGLKKPRPVGLQKPRWPNEFRRLDEENPLRVTFEEAEAKKKAEDAAEFQAAVKALKAHDLYKEAAYQVILGEVEGWVDRGGAKETAASWIRRLMSKGKDRLRPSRVRLKYKAVKHTGGARPGAA